MSDIEYETTNEENLKNDTEIPNAEEEAAILNKIFIGAFDDNIPETKRKLVRIFTSSTFTGKLIDYHYIIY